MTGTLINVAAILAGGCLGLALRRPLPPRLHSLVRACLAALVLYSGFGMMLAGMSGGWTSGAGQLLVVFVATVAGKALGKALRIQKAMHGIAVFAEEQMALPPKKRRRDAGFLVGSGLYCLTPLAFLGPAAEGFAGWWQPLLIKAAMDFMGASTFVRAFGPGFLLSAVPVLSLQGTLALGCAALPEAVAITGPAVMASGWILLGAIPVLYGVARIRLGDYLPAIALAPLLAQIWWPGS